MTDAARVPSCCVQYRAILIAPGGRPAVPAGFAGMMGVGGMAGFVGGVQVPAAAMGMAPMMMQGQPAMPPVAVAQAAPVVPAATTMMRVTCPPGSGPGASIQIMSPSGQQLTVVVPAGIAPGGQFDVQVPSAPPVAVAAVATAVPMAGVVA